VEVVERPPAQALTTPNARPLADANGVLTVPAATGAR
jgi:hypothetical protein